MVRILMILDGNSGILRLWTVFSSSPLDSFKVKFVGYHTMSAVEGLVAPYTTKATLISNDFRW